MRGGKYEPEWSANQVRVLLEQRMDQDDTALRLQYEETERRLAELNGEAGRIRQILNESVTSEKYETNRANDEANQKLERERTDERFVKLEAFQSRIIGAFVVLSALMATLGFLIGRVL